MNYYRMISNKWTAYISNELLVKLVLGWYQIHQYRSEQIAPVLGQLLWQTQRHPFHWNPPSRGMGFSTNGIFHNRKKSYGSPFLQLKLPVAGIFQLWGLILLLHRYGVVWPSEKDWTRFPGMTSLFLGQDISLYSKMKLSLFPIFWVE